MPHDYLIVGSEFDLKGVVAQLELYILALEKNVGKKKLPLHSGLAIARVERSEELVDTESLGQMWKDHRKLYHTRVCMYMYSHMLKAIQYMAFHTTEVRITIMDN